MMGTTVEALLQANPGTLSRIPRIGEFQDFGKHMYTMMQLQQYRNECRIAFNAAPRATLFDAETAAIILDVSTFMLGQWRHRKAGPAWHKIGRAPKYMKSDLLRFIQSSKIAVAPTLFPPQSKGVEAEVVAIDAQIAELFKKRKLFVGLKYSCLAKRFLDGESTTSISIGCGVSVPAVTRRIHLAIRALNPPVYDQLSGVNNRAPSPAVLRASKASFLYE